MRKLRIALVSNLWESIPPKNKAGLEQMVSQLTEELVKRGHDVTLFATEDSQTTATLVPIWPTAVSRDTASQKRSMRWYSNYATSIVYNRADEFDIIHDHTYDVGAQYGHLLNTPVVLTMHHPASYEEELRAEFPPQHRLFLDQYEEEQYQKSNIVVVSKFQQKELLRLFNRSSDVVYNGLPLDTWQQFSSTPGEYVAFLGYISGNKGVAEAIQAVLKTDEKLIIAGPIDEHDVATQTYYETQVKPFVDGEKIQYIGPLGLEEKQQFLRDAKVLLMPIQWDEPFGLVAIESMGCGTPVIGLNRAALPEIIKDQQTGFIVNSIDEMAEKIKEIPTIDRTACRKLVEAQFSAEQMAAGYEQVYYRLIDERA